MERKLVPYSVYISKEHHEKLRAAAKDRKAAAIVRNAITMMLDGHDLFDSGYNKGLEDAAQVIYDCPEGQLVAVRGKDIGVVLSEKIKSLHIQGKPNEKT